MKSKECKVVLVDNLRPCVNVKAKIFTVPEQKMDKPYNRKKAKRDIRKFIEEERKMIIFKCDVCGRTTPELQSFVFYKEKVDCCAFCEWKVKDQMKEFEKERAYENTLFDSALRKKEKEILKKLKEGEEKYE